MISMQPVTFESPIGIDFAGTCDLAIWCKLLHDKGWSGARIGRAIAKSEGYVNNLIRVVERASPSVMLRWRAEQSGMLDHVCATDWLVSVCLLPHAGQDEELQRRIAARPTLERRAPPDDPPAEASSGATAPHLVMSQLMTGRHDVDVVLNVDSTVAVDGSAAIRGR